MKKTKVVEQLVVPTCVGRGSGLLMGLEAAGTVIKRTPGLSDAKDGDEAEDGGDRSRRQPPAGSLQQSALGSEPRAHPAEKPLRRGPAQRGGHRDQLGARHRLQLQRTLAAPRQDPLVCIRVSAAARSPQGGFAGQLVDRLGEAGPATGSGAVPELC